MTSPGSDSGTGHPGTATTRRVVAASFIGNLVEWFDYAVYGYLATTIAVVFFPATSPTAGLLATFGVFALSFVVRPVGGIFWGYFGDRFGRRSALSLSILIMSVATFVIALLPGYAQVGVLAPVLLLVVRTVQGFSAAGEYAGAAAFLFEYAPRHRRGLHTSVVPASTAAGLLLGSVVVTVLTSTLPPEAVESWGWRVPFLLAAPLGLIGRYIRTKLEDTPEFRVLAERESVARTPLKETFAHNKRAIVVAFGATCLNAVGFYTLLSYMPTYLTTELHLDESDAFLSTTIALVGYIGAVFAMGRLADVVGRRAMLAAAGILFAVLAVPVFLLLGPGGLVGITLVQLALGTVLTLNDAALPAYLAELFPTRVRYSGFAFSFNTANAVFGGTAPFVATALIHGSGSVVAPAWYLAAAGAVAAFSLLASRRIRTTRPTAPPPRTREEGSRP
ncbi:MFS transporter [Saccharopolyspora cebuensis]|uniref:MFS transporter n=1 Tax=Saccharopolyspora cebuensis TaxID=418759 RepID=A0ABV4CGF5_9PSEU